MFFQKVKNTFIKFISCCRKRKGISRKVALLTFNHSERECFYCEKKLEQFEPRINCWNLDHIKSFHYGGEDSIKNYAAACVECNSMKSDLPVSEFLHKKGVRTRRCMEIVTDPNFIHINPEPINSSKKEKKTRRKKKEVEVLHTRFCRNRFQDDLNEKFCPEHRNLERAQEYESCFCTFCCCYFCFGQCKQVNTTTNNTFYPPVLSNEQGSSSIV